MRKTASARVGVSRVIEECRGINGRRETLGEMALKVLASLWIGRNLGKKETRNERKHVL